MSGPFNFHHAALFAILCSFLCFRSGNDPFLSSMMFVMASGEAYSKTRGTLERKRELKHEYAAIIMLGECAEVTAVGN